MSSYSFFNRDVSWLSFNERLLIEAEKAHLPLGERINFLSIYSSNLDEFYRVRMPALLALHTLGKDKNDVLAQINTTIRQQQQRFGRIISRGILPALKKNNIYLLYNTRIASALKERVTEFFFDQVAAFLHIIDLAALPKDFFPGNNMLYIATAVTGKTGKEQCFVINIPSDSLSRFYTIEKNGRQYILFLDDIIKSNLDKVFPGRTISECGSFKITRDAELDLEDEFEGDLARKIEKKITRRDFGLATRLLYEPSLSTQRLAMLHDRLGLNNATLVEGGSYHNLKDLSSLPLNGPAFFYERWPVVKHAVKSRSGSLFSDILAGDIMLHTPYQSYDTVLRFFNEAAVDAHVTRIYVTLYRVASESRIVNALISAARNGKKVTVFVELKARFDEANNIRWAKKMKAAGVKIIYSIPALKVHAKIALVKRKYSGKVNYLGLLSTGNFNENTARFYTDHVLFTARQDMLHEMEVLFGFLKQRKKPAVPAPVTFKHLLVAQFNLQPRFLQLIDREIDHARQGLPAAITIKLNNLEDKVLIGKLYEASNAGIHIRLIVRSVCCLTPGVPGQSERITVTRIVDRYLEHGRIFIFQNNSSPEVYMGSADWMNRNIYRRIEVCFPVYSEVIKEEIRRIVDLQVADNVQAVSLDSKLNNAPVAVEKKARQVRSQQAIGALLGGGER